MHVYHFSFPGCFRLSSGSLSAIFLYLLSFGLLFRKWNRFHRRQCEYGQFRRVGYLNSCTEGGHTHLFPEKIVLRFLFFETFLSYAQNQVVLSLKARNKSHYVTRSFNGGVNQFNLAASNVGNGMVTIQYGMFVCSAPYNRCIFSRKMRESEEKEGKRGR